MITNLPGDSVVAGATLFLEALLRFQSSRICGAQLDSTPEAALHDNDEDGK